MGYEPQLSKKEIGKIYRTLYEDFSKKSFDEAVEQCREIIKKYYSCFPLLLQMGELLMSASVMTDDKEKSSDLITQAKDLFVRVKTQSDNAELIKTALFTEASCAMLQGKHNEVIELLEKPFSPLLPHEILLSSAYEATGRNAEAKSILQAGIFENIISVLSLLTTYAQLSIEDIGRVEEIVKRTEAIVESFNIKKFQGSSILSHYVIAAQSCLINKNIKKSLDFLEQYTELVEGDISFQIKGDSFFDSIDNWLNENELYSPITPHETIKTGLADIVINNPNFSVLNDNPRYQNIVKRLKRAI
jgi:tetratricopeptide (TPR) repeat protein